MMNLGLEGKVAIITGGSQGIGKAAAQRLTDEGANVVIVARQPDALDAAAGELRQTAAGEVLPLQCDVTSENAADRIVNETLSQFGRLDILVNNAGTAFFGPFDTLSDEAWATDFDLKVWSAIRLIRRSLQEMRKQNGGRIINVTAIAGRTPGAGSMPTSIARATGIAMTKAMSKEFAKDNILVNTVCVSFIKSAQQIRHFQQRDPGVTPDRYDTLYREEAARRGIPLGRAGEAREAGDVIAFLASERASYVTGVAINIDGGLSPVI